MDELKIAYQASEYLQHLHNRFMMEHATDFDYGKYRGARDMIEALGGKIVRAGNKFEVTFD